MRILLLAQWYPPIVGGEELHVRNLGAALARRGHEVSIATLAHHGAPRFERDGAVRIHRLAASVQRLPWLFSGARQSAPPVPDPGLVRGLRAVVRHETPQIVHAHNWMVHSFLPLVHPERPPRLVLSLHDYSLICAIKNLVYFGDPCSGPAPAKCLRCAAAHYGVPKSAATVPGLWAGGWLARRRVDRFVAVSNAVAEGNRLTTQGLPHEVIPNFIPDEDEDEDVGPGAVGLLERLPEEPFLLFVGSFARIKGIDVLLAAYRRLHSPPPLVLIGYRGSERMAELDDPPPGVTILEDWPHAAVLAAWRKSLLGVVPSTWNEPCPTVAMEALAAGRPVVASRAGGLPDIVRDQLEGILVPMGDAAALARALQTLLDDTSARQRMAGAALVRAASFRASRVVPRLEALYADVVQGRRPEFQPRLHKD